MHHHHHHHQARLHTSTIVVLCCCLSWIISSACAAACAAASFQSSELLASSKHLLVGLHTSQRRRQQQRTSSPSSSSSPFFPPIKQQHHQQPRQQQILQQQQSQQRQPTTTTTIQKQQEQQNQQTTNTRLYSSSKTRENDTSSFTTVAATATAIRTNEDASSSRSKTGKKTSSSASASTTNAPSLFLFGKVNVVPTLQDLYDLATNIKSSMQEKSKVYEQSILAIRQELEQSRQSIMKYYKVDNEEDPDYADEKNENAALQEQEFKLQQQQQWSQRMKLETEMSALKHSYEEDIKEWKQRHHNLSFELSRQQRTFQITLEQSKQNAELQLKQALAQKESQINATRTKLLAQQEQQQMQLQTARDQQKQLQQKLETVIKQYTNEQDVLRKQLQAVNDAFQQYKLQAHETLETEQQRAQQQQQTLLQQIQEVQNNLNQQRSMTVAQASRVQHVWQKRMQLEAELSELEKQYSNAQSQWENKVRTLEQQLAKADEEAAAAANQQAFLKAEAMEQKNVLLSSLQDHKKKYRLEIQHIRDVARTTEHKITERLTTVSEEYQQFKFEAHKELMKEKDKASKQLTDLSAQLELKTKQFEEQCQVTDEQTKKAHELWANYQRLEAELSTLQTTYEAAIADWEAKYDALQDSKFKDAKGASLELQRRDAEARRQINEAMQQTEAVRIQLQTESKLKEAKLQETIHQTLQSAAEKEQQLMDNLQGIKNEFQQYKQEVKQNWKAEMDRTAAERDRLNKIIQERELALQEQTKLVTELGANVTNEHEEVLKLQQEILSLKSQFNATASNWETRYGSLRREFEIAKQQAGEEIAKQEAVAKEQIAAILQEAQVRTTALQEELRQKEEDRLRSIQMLQQDFEQKEHSLRQSLEGTTTEYQNFKIASEKKWIAEQEAAQAKQHELSTAIADREKQVQELLVVKAENEKTIHEVGDKRAALEQELGSLKKQYTVAVTDWEKRYKSLQEIRARDQKLAEEQLQSKEDEMRKEVDGMIAEVEQEIAVHLKNFKAKERLYNATIAELRTSMAVKEKNLSELLEIKSKEVVSLQNELQLQVQAEKNKAIKEKNKFIEQLNQKQKQLDEQVAAAQVIGKKVEEERTRRLQLAEKLAATTSSQEKMVAEWQMRYRVLKGNYTEMKEKMDGEIAKARADAKLKIEEVRSQTEIDKKIMKDAIRTRDKQFDRTQQRVRELEARCVSVEDQWAKDKESFARELSRVKSETQIDAKTAMARAENALRRSMMIVEERERELQGEIQQVSAVVDKLQTLLQTAGVANGRAQPRSTNAWF